MAATAVEDDEAWLYGDEAKEKENLSSASNGKVKKEEVEEGQLSGEEETQAKSTAEDSDDDDDDDDDVQVTIGDIKQWSVGDKLFKGSGTYQKPAGVVVTKSGSTTSKSFDVDVVGQINGVPTYEFDIQSIEDKPWRKPGADITDYFNYGFDEESWQHYCEKQKRLRLDNGASYNTLSGSTVKKEKDSLYTQGNAVATLIGRKAAPPPNRKYYGTIDVIGSTARDTRRPPLETSAIPIAGATEYNPAIPPPGMAPPTLPDYSVPPPGLGPPPSILPPGVAPNVALPPPNFHPPPGFYPTPGTIDSTSVIPGQIGKFPTNRYEERGYSYDPVTGTYGYNATTTSSSWDNRSNYDRYDYPASRRDRSPVSEDEFASSHRDRDRDRDRSSSYRDRSRDKDRDRDRGRDRDRERERDRDRSRDRDSSRERRHRDDKHKRRRFKEEKDDDHHSSSKHKKSSRKKHKEGEESATDDNKE